MAQEVESVGAQASPEGANETPQAGQPSATDAVKGGCGCLLLLIVGVIVIRFFMVPQYDAIAGTQSTAMTVTWLIESNGEESLLATISAMPESEREEGTRQLVDFWISSGKPRLYPTEGVDADWLLNDAKRRIVKRRMVRNLLEAASKTAK